MELNFLTLADENFALPLAVLGRSLMENLGPGQRAVLRVIDGGISNAAKERLLRSWMVDGDRERFRAEFVAPDFGGMPELPVWGRLPALTYARIFAADYVAQDCPRVVLLDSDMLVLTDLSRLWEEDLSAHLLAVPDEAIPVVSSPGGLAGWKALGLATDAPFFNAGLMVIDPAKWREDRIAQQTIHFIGKHSHELNNCDQDGLNAVLAGKWTPLDARWQMQPRMRKLRGQGLTRQGLTKQDLTKQDLTTQDLTTQASAHQGLTTNEDPWIVHFSGRLKPWIDPGITTYDDLFHSYLDRTEWKGVRPVITPRSHLTSIYEAHLRRFVYPLERKVHGVYRGLTRRWEKARTERER